MSISLMAKLLSIGVLGLVLFAGAAFGGATLKVNTSAVSVVCDDKLSLGEATNLASGNGNMGPITTAEKNQISGANWVAVPTSVECGGFGWSPVNGIGPNFADDIIFTNEAGTLFGAFLLGKNDDIDGLRPDGQKVILDGTGFVAGNSGLSLETESGSQVRNLIIRHYPNNGIFAQALNGAKFEGLEIAFNGTNGMSIGFAGGTTNKNSRNTTIGGTEPQQRNKIFSNGTAGISIVSSPSFDRFPDEGIFIINNLIGTSDGVHDDGNGGRGISLINAFGVIIGDSTSATRNIISGNSSDGITLDGPGAISNVIIGNFIGTADSGGSRLGNGAAGIALLNSAGSTADFISTGPNKIGMPGLGNVISANNYGIFIADPNTSLNRVQANLIGTNLGGNADLGNNADGIYFVNGTFDNQIGGTGSGEGNLIAFNANGIKADSGVRNSFRRNRIFSNDNLGIDLAPLGVTPNDSGDGDAGPNNLQNFPVITFVNSQSSTVVLNGTFNSAPNQTYSLDFYGNSAVNPTGFGEGRNFIGTATVTTDGTGSGFFFGQSFNSTLSNTGSWVTATATDANGNTSEFSQARNICSNMGFSPVSATYGVGAGSGNFTLVQSSGCGSATAQSSVSWANVTGVSAGTVTYTVAPNTGPARSGVINVTFNNGSGTSVASFLLSQDGGCAYNLSHFQASYSAGGIASDGLTLTAAPTACVWTAVPNASWITILAGASGSGNGTVTWSVAPNTGPARQGTVTVAGQTFTINQASGCQYSLSRSSASYPASGILSDNLSVTCNAGCGWTTVPNAAWITILSGGNGTGNGTVSWSVAANTGPARQSSITIAGQTFTINQAAGTVSVHTPFDFDGDHKSDVSVFRTSAGAWYLNRSTAGPFGITWGLSTDKITPADYDGDGKTDIAVFRPSEGQWYMLMSATNTFSSSLWGAAADIPAPADYDGDGRADVAIFRPSDGNWWINRSTLGTTTIPYGQNGDVPVAGNYDGDAKADIAVFRPSNGLWSIHKSSGGDTGFMFGISTDKVAEGDYDGDGKTDIAVFRPSSGTWYIAYSATATFASIGFGAAGDIPAPADYDGDGKTDIAIFRPSDGNWWLNRSTAGVTVMQFGQNGDKPVPNAFGN